MEDYKKKYEELIESIKEAKERMGGYTFSSVVDKIMPELKESEDERIRKECISIIDAWDKSCRLQGDYCEVAPKCIAWLEKQGELVNSLSNGLDNAHERIDGLIQKNNSLIEQLEKNQGEQKPKFRVGDTIKCKYDDRQFTIKSVDLDRGTYTYTQEGCGNDIDYADEEFELVEQNFADKVEPKFKVGDTIVEKDLDECGCGTIVNIKDGKYIFDDGCFIRIKEQEGWQLVKTPAKIDQKPSWSEEDDIEISVLINALGELRTYGGDFSEQKNWLKSLKERYTCKPSDEQKPIDLNAISIQKLVDVYRNTDEYDEYGDFKGKPVNCMVRAYEQGIRDILKRIKQKDVKPAWSDEDERMRIYACKFIDDAKQIDYSVSHKEEIDKCISWLKSLKERYTWKPSDEQMTYLSQVMDRNDYCGSVLYSLYQELKRL